MRDQADPDLLVGEFFRDLRDAVVQMSTLQMADGIGFMDRDFRPGYKWPDRLAEALATCKVFVPLYSPRYFTRENCGKEWSAFAARVAAATARREAQVEAIVPALWVPVPSERLPEVAQPIHYWTPDYGSRYASHGLYGLIAISKYRDEYREVVHELARRILDVAEKSQLVPGPIPSYKSLHNAFADEAGEIREADERRALPPGPEAPAITGEGAFVSDLPSDYDVPLNAKVNIDGDEYERIVRRITTGDGESATPVTAFNSSI